MVVPHGIEPALAARRHSRGRTAPAVRARRRAGPRLPGGHAPAQESRRSCSTMMRDHWTDPDLRLVLTGGRGHGRARSSAACTDRRVLPSRPRAGGRPQRAARDGAGAGVPQSLRGVRGTADRGDDARCARWSCSDATCMPADRRRCRHRRARCDRDAWAGALDEVDRRRDELVAAGHRRAQDVHVAAPAVRHWRRSTRERCSCHELAAAAHRRAVPALRARHRAHRRGDHARSSTSSPPSATSSTSSPRCRGTASTRRGRAGTGAWIRREVTPWGSITRVHPFPGTDKRNLRPPRARVRRVQRARRRWRRSAVAGSTPSSRCRRRSRWGSPAGARTSCAAVRWCSTSRTCSPTRPSRPGRSPNRRVIAVARWLERLELPPRRSGHRAQRRPARQRRRRRCRRPRRRPGARHPQLRRHRRSSGPLDRLTPLRAELGIGDEPVVLYAGNVGFSQSLEMVVDAARRFPHVDVPDQRRRRGPRGAAGAGGRAGQRAVQRLPAQGPGARGAGHRRHPPRAAARRASGRVSVPSKTYSILAAGRPVLAAIDPGTEVPRLLAASGGGVAVPPDDLEAFCTALDALLADPDHAAGHGRGRSGVGGGRGVAGGGGRWPTSGSIRVARPAAPDRLFGCRADSLAPSWPRHRPPTKSPSSPRGARARRSASRAAPSSRSSSPSSIIVDARARRLRPGHAARPSRAVRRSPPTHWSMRLRLPRLRRARCPPLTGTAAEARPRTPAPATSTKVQHRHSHADGVIHYHP